MANEILKQVEQDLEAGHGLYKKAPNAAAYTPEVVAAARANMDKAHEGYAVTFSELYAAREAGKLTDAQYNEAERAAYMKRDRAKGIWELAAQIKY